MIHAYALIENRHMLAFQRRMVTKRWSFADRSVTFFLIFLLLFCYGRVYGLRSVDATRNSKGFINKHWTRSIRFYLGALTFNEEILLSFSNWLWSNYWSVKVLIKIVASNLRSLICNQFFSSNHLFLCESSKLPKWMV